MARELQVVGIHGAQLGVDCFKAAAELERHEERRHGREDHQNALDHVRHHDRADAACHAVENYRDAHDDDAHPLRRTRVGREDDARADRLRAHHWNKEDEHQNGEKTAQSRRLIAVGEVVCHREHSVTVSETDELAAHEERRDDHRKRDAGHRDAHAGVAHVVDRPRHAHEGGHGVLGGEVRKTRENRAGGSRHREEVSEVLVLAVAPPADDGKEHKIGKGDGEKWSRRGFNLIRHDHSSSYSWYSGRFRQALHHTKIVKITKSP